MMQQYLIVNTGKRTRYRAGHKFEPGVETEVELSKHAVRAVLATRDLAIVTDHGDTGNTETGDADITGLSIKAILAGIDEGKFDPQKVYEAELEGAGRVSLLDKLDGMLADEDRDELVVTKTGDDTPDTSTPDDDTGGERVTEPQGNETEDVEDVVPDTSTPNDETGDDV